jgi:1-acyl-sn-glycerol-3-phosphate acyltransferase
VYHRTRRFIHRRLLQPFLRRYFSHTVAGRLEGVGPTIVVANHNSHLDTALLLAAFPTSHIDRVRPIAAADYFMRNRLIAWFSTRLVGIVPLDRNRSDTSDPLGGATQALRAGDTLVMFPEGTRGTPGVFADLKAGVARLAASHPHTPVIPVWLDGCEQAFPKGARLPRRAMCTTTIGPALYRRTGESEAAFLARLRRAMLALTDTGQVAA